MQSQYSRLDDLGPVCCDDTINDLHWRTPRPILSANISLLWEILDLTVQDWKREVVPFQTQIDGAINEGEEMIFTGQAFMKLQPHYLKCLFSYITFFVALENAYDLFYQDLNELNSKPFLRVKHGKKPKRSDYIDKVRRIRNISIAHLGSTKVNLVDSMAGMMWQPMGLSKKIDEVWNIEQMIFGGMKYRAHDSDGNPVESSDFEIKGVLELNTECTEYLDEYDRVCADYLSAIISKLPLNHDGIRYYKFGADGTDV